MNNGWGCLICGEEVGRSGDFIRVRNSVICRPCAVNVTAELERLEKTGR